MNKKLSLFLIVSLLSVQMFSLLHMAEYDFEKHEHNGQVCDIYLFSEHTKYAEPGSAFSTPSPDYVVFKALLPEQSVAGSKTYRTSSPRAPPLFS